MQEIKIQYKETYSITRSIPISVGQILLLRSNYMKMIDEVKVEEKKKDSVLPQQKQSR